MAPSNPQTFEEVDKHVQAADLDAFNPGGKHHFASAAGIQVPPNLCAVYKIVRPILVLLSNTPLIPAKWRAAIQVFIKVMDVICP